MTLINIYKIEYQQPNKCSKKRPSSHTNTSLLQIMATTEQDQILEFAKTLLRTYNKSEYLSLQTNLSVQLKNHLKQHHELIQGVEKIYAARFAQLLDIKSTIIQQINKQCYHKMQQDLEELCKEHHKKVVVNYHQIREIAKTGWLCTQIKIKEEQGMMQENSQQSQGTNVIKAQKSKEIPKKQRNKTNKKEMESKTIKSKQETSSIKDKSKKRKRENQQARNNRPRKKIMIRIPKKTKY